MYGRNCVWGNNWEARQRLENSRCKARHASACTIDCRRVVATNTDSLTMYVWLWTRIFCNDLLPQTFYIIQLSPTTPHCPHTLLEYITCYTFPSSRGSCNQTLFGPQSKYHATSLVATISELSRLGQAPVFSSSALQKNPCGSEPTRSGVSCADSGLYSNPSPTNAI